MTKARQKLVILCGPTAVGKSQAALALAQELGAEIVSADSMQVYCKLDIGTSKPSPEARARIRHHLIDLVDPSQDFDAAAYARAAWEAVQDIGRRGRIALVVGGTGLYLRAFLTGLFSCPPKDKELRQRLLGQGLEEGGLSLHRSLALVDAESARRIPATDLYRIVRALEVYYLTGRPLSEHFSRQSQSPPGLPVLKLGLIRERAQLYRRIEERTEEMFQAGLIDEVRNLLSVGYSEQLHPLRSMTYRPVIEYLKGSLTSQEMVAAVKTGTKRYAKRQLTWFKAERDISWMDAGQPFWEGGLRNKITQFLEGN